MNTLIRELLRAWLVSSIGKALQEHSAFKDAAEMVADVLASARKSRSKRQIDKALVLLEGCLAYAQAETEANRAGSGSGANPNDVFLAMYDESYSLLDDQPTSIVLVYFNNFGAENAYICG